MKKTDPKDPLARNLVLLGLIPRHPKGVTTVELQTSLENKGFHVDLRTLQRDLSEKLSAHFPIACDESQRPYRWSFTPHAQISLPEMDPSSALVMNLAEGHLRHLLPPGVLAVLEPQFQLARRQMQGLEHNTLSHWARRVRAIPNGKALLPATVDPDIWTKVANALLQRRQLQVDYLSRVKGETRAMRLHPTGLVSRGPVTYLIATVGDYEDLRHFALHRVQRADVLEEPARDSSTFDIDAYMPAAAFSPRQGTGTVELVVDVHPQIAWTLRETPLSEDQTMEPISNSEWLRLRASVPDDQETSLWLFGIGEQARLHAPGSWLNKLKTKLSNMQALYPHENQVPTRKHNKQRQINRSNGDEPFA